MTIEEERHAFLMGWQRARHTVNAASRRQAKKAANKNVLDAFATGWHVQKLFKLLLGDTRVDSLLASECGDDKSLRT